MRFFVFSTIVILVLYGLGRYLVSGFHKYAEFPSQKKRWSKTLRNPVACFFWGFPALILVPFDIMDRILKIPSKGYYNGSFFYRDDDRR